MSESKFTSGYGSVPTQPALFASKQNPITVTNRKETVMAIYTKNATVI